MQNAATEMRECVGCKTTVSLDNFEKNRKGVRFKTCMHCRNNDQGMKNIFQRMYRRDNRKQIREIRKTYDEANKEKIKRGRQLTENPTRIK